jgi:hypothetical protein
VQGLGPGNAPDALVLHQVDPFPRHARRRQFDERLAARTAVTHRTVAEDEAALLPLQRHAVRLAEVVELVVQPDRGEQRIGARSNLAKTCLGMRLDESGERPEQAGIFDLGLGRAGARDDRD